MKIGKIILVNVFILILVLLVFCMEGSIVFDQGWFPIINPEFWVNHSRECIATLGVLVSLNLYFVPRYIKPLKINTNPQFINDQILINIDLINRSIIPITIEDILINGYECNKMDFIKVKAHSTERINLKFNKIKNYSDLHVKVYYKYHNKNKIRKTKKTL